MRVKFNLPLGNTVSIIARNRKGEETDNVADAIRIFNAMTDNMPFQLATEGTRSLPATTPAATTIEAAVDAPEAI